MDNIYELIIEARKSVAIRLGCGVLIAIPLVACQVPTVPDNSNSAEIAPTPKTMSKEQTLKTLTAKINDFALQPLDRRYDPEGYAKVGKRVWDTSNELRRWAGLAALQSKSCKAVSAIALWEQATRSQLSWQVVCGDERFVISEAQARSVRAQLDPDAPAADRKAHGAAGEAAQPMSAAFANFSVASAVVACDDLMKEASVDKGSYDPSWSWGEELNDETGQAIISREYSSKNAMGGTVSGRYQCVVSAADGNVVKITTRDALGVHAIF